MRRIFLPLFAALVFLSSCDASPGRVVDGNQLSVEEREAFEALSVDIYRKVFTTGSTFLYRNEHHYFPPNLEKRADPPIISFGISVIYVTPEQQLEVKKLASLARVEWGEPGKTHSLSLEEFHISTTSGGGSMYSSREILSIIPLRVRLE